MIRIGHGFDVHKIEQDVNAHIPIGGVLIPGYRVIAHSDGDVVLHAVVDAILGAIANGDIGEHFHPSNPAYKDVDSTIFVKHAMQLLANQGYSMQNIDITLLAERPKISQYKMQMREIIAKLLSVSIDYVSVKATTTEKLGFVGRAEGIAAEAVCLVVRK